LKSASAGLNLRWDRFFYEARGATWGPAESPVRLCSYNSDRPVPFDVEARVVERAGCDAAPVDPHPPRRPPHRLSYVRPDEIHRIRLLRAALIIAADTPVQIDRGDALDWTNEHGWPRPGVVTVVHSIVMQYLPDGHRPSFKELVRSRGAEGPTITAPHVVPDIVAPGPPADGSRHS
jgi:hypothetical protein